LSKFDIKDIFYVIGKLCPTQSNDVNVTSTLSSLFSNYLDKLTANIRNTFQYDNQHRIDLVCNFLSIFLQIPEYSLLIQTTTPKTMDFMNNFNLISIKNIDEKRIIESLSQIEKTYYDNNLKNASDKSVLASLNVC
jgi:hypothetical protein